MVEHTGHNVHPVGFLVLEVRPQRTFQHIEGGKNLLWPIACGDKTAGSNLKFRKRFIDCQVLIFHSIEQFRAFR